MRIDTHTHFYDPTRPQGVPWPPADNKLLYRPVLPGHYRAIAEPLGISGTVVVQAGGWLEDTQWLLDLAEAEPVMVAIVGQLAPGRPEFQDELARFAARPRFRGIRCGGDYFNALPTAAFVDDMATMAAQNLSLDVLVRAEHLPQVIALAQAVPTLRIIVNHIAHMPIDGRVPPPEWAERYRALAAAPNIFMKVSAVPEQSTVHPAPAEPEFYRPALDLLWQSFGSERLIYGSNWPVCERVGDDLALGLWVVTQFFAAQGEVASARYFWQNAELVYQWPKDA